MAIKAERNGHSRRLLEDNDELAIDGLLVHVERGQGRGRSDEGSEDNG